MEETFELPLFDRVRNRLQLTAAGQRYVERISPLLHEIERATLDLLAERPAHRGDTQQSLRLSMLPTIGAKWLIPRLPEFLAKHPEIDLVFAPFADGYDFSRPELDCAIRYGRGVWAGARADYLVGREVVVISAPSTTAQLRTVQDVRHFTLLHHVAEPDGWARWCAHQQVTDVRTLAGPRIDQVSSQVQAVIAGMGIALVPRCLVEDEIRAGTVVEAPFPVFTETAGYYLCYPETKAQVPALLAFRAWILALCRR